MIKYEMTRQMLDKIRNMTSTEYLFFVNANENNKNSYFPIRNKTTNGIFLARFGREQVHVYKQSTCSRGFLNPNLRTLPGLTDIANSDDNSDSFYNDCAVVLKKKVYISAFKETYADTFKNYDLVSWETAEMYVDEDPFALFELEHITIGSRIFVSTQYSTWVTHGYADRLIPHAMYSIGYEEMGSFWQDVQSQINRYMLAQKLSHTPVEDTSYRSSVGIYI